ncbi:MAG: PD40 domain-containing protein [Prolixibacteraceae bacterium]|nr:PD40 domain-containing protein [Prolixibacteraceae bacterium]
MNFNHFYSIFYITKPKLSIVVLLLLISFSCSDDMEECKSFPEVPSSPYDDPIWHPSGEIIGFNHIPVKEIRFNDGYKCPRNPDYFFEEDSIGFWLINADGTNQRRVLPYTLHSPVWSPDGNWIAITQGGNIFKIPFDGEQFDTTAIEQLTFEGIGPFPALSPKSNYIAYTETTCSEIKQCGIWMYDINSGKQELIGLYGMYPSWHPFNDSLIFLTNVIDSKGNDIGDSIWIYNTISNTKHQFKYISLPHYDTRLLQYSPTGKEIAFISALNSGGGPQLYTINSDGSNLKQLTTTGAQNFSWSPDGEIVYLNFDYSIDETKGTLWVMDADGNNKRQLTHNNFKIIE